MSTDDSDGVWHDSLCRRHSNYKSISRGQDRHSGVRRETSVVRISNQAKSCIGGIECCQRQAASRRRRLIRLRIRETPTAEVSIVVSQVCGQTKDFRQKGLNTRVYRLEWLSFVSRITCRGVRLTSPASRLGKREVVARGTRPEADVVPIEGGSVRRQEVRAAATMVASIAATRRAQVVTRASVAPTVALIELTVLRELKEPFTARTSTYGRIRPAPT